MCISVPYGNTEGPVGYTSVRRLQHVHVWMCVDMSRAYVRSTARRTERQTSAISRDDKTRHDNTRHNDRTTMTRHCTIA